MRLIHDKVKHYLALVPAHKLALVDRVDDGVHAAELDGDIGVAELESVLDFAPLRTRLEDLLVLVEHVQFVLAFLFGTRLLHHSN